MGIASIAIKSLAHQPSKIRRSIACSACRSLFECAGG
jgi:hypothetical protein